MRFLFILPLFFVFSVAEITPPQNFNKAKDLMRTKVYHDLGRELYCNCQFEWRGWKGIVDVEACGYNIRANDIRARRIEWEHVLPISVIGRQMLCWKSGGRNNCQNTSSVFNKAEADIHNLLPVIGEINADRANFRFSPVEKPSSGYGTCNARIDFKARKMEPRDEIKGMVSRITLYMHDRYKLNISKQDKRVLEAWNKLYPVTAWEKERNQRNACIMGWGNDYISEVDLSLCKQKPRRHRLVFLTPKLYAC